jgi:hypothetical protein
VIAIIEHIPDGGAYITASDQITSKSIYLEERELRSLYESLMVYYGDCKNPGKTAGEN